LDTGATCSTLNWDILVAVGYDPAKTKGRIKVTTGSGIEYLPLVKIKKLVAWGKERKRFPILCHTLPPSATVDGLLGLDFLRQAIDIGSSRGSGDLEIAKR
jgi:predicted aspartyl protease